MKILFSFQSKEKNKIDMNKKISFGDTKIHPQTNVHGRKPKSSKKKSKECISSQTKKKLTECPGNFTQTNLMVRGMPKM